MHCPINCVLCDSNYEEKIHVFLECPSAMHILRKPHLWDKIDRALRQNYNMDKVVFTMLSTLDPSQSAPFGTIMWSIWKRRNLKL
jgi:hypothetical protein